MDSNRSSDNSNRGLLIAIICLLAALVSCLVILIVVLLSKGNSSQQTLSTESLSTSVPEATLPIEETIPATEAQTVIETPEPSPAGDERLIFREVLQSIHDNHSYQDAIFEPLTPDDQDIGHFDIRDFDGDGKDELLVLWDDTSMAAMVGILYGVNDSGEVFIENWCFPSLRIYSNGIIEADISHNQGLAGAFWPYYFSRYNPETDSYEGIGGADAWDKSLAEVDYDGNPYPEYADTSQSGIVYYIDDPDYEKRGQPVDVTEYEAWHQELLSGADQIAIVPKLISNEMILASTS